MIYKTIERNMKKRYYIKAGIPLSGKTLWDEYEIHIDVSKKTLKNP